MRASVGTVLAVVLWGCGDEGTEVSADAVSEVSDIADTGSAESLPLTPADVERLATLANVEPDVLESVGASLTERDVWLRSMDGVRAIYDDAPAGVESTLVDVACQAVAGSVHTDYQLHYAIFQRVNGFDEEEINGLTETAFGLHQALYEASGSDLAEDRAAAVLTCHTLEETQG